MESEIVYNNGVSYFFEKYILVFLLLGSALFINPLLNTDVFEFPKLLTLYFSVGILTVLTIIDIGLHGWPRRFARFRAPFIFLGIFAAAQILAYIFSTDQVHSIIGLHGRYQGFLTNIHYILLGLNTFYFFNRHPHSKTKSLFWWLIVALFFVSLFALLPYSFFHPSLFQNRVFGTFGNPNYLASFLIALFPLYIFAHRLRWNFFVPLLIILLIALFLTGSRSAWTAFLIAFLMVGVARSIKWKQSKMLIVALLIFTVIASTIMIQKYFPSESLSRFSVQPQHITSLKTRLSLWNAGLRLFWERPLVGFGQDTVKENIEHFLPERLKANEIFYIDRTHSEPIDVLVTTGIFGLIGYLGFFGFIGVRGLIFPLQDRYFLAALTGFIALFLFHAVNFGTITSNILLYFLSGYLLSRMRQDPLY